MAGATRPGLGRAILRTLLCLTFFGGGIVHFILGGGSSAQGYAAFGETALLPALSDLWTSFVMPNIRLLTILLGVAEVAIAVLLAMYGRAQRIGVVLAIGFFVFLIVLGTGWVGATGIDDLLKNRLPLIVLIALMLPFVTRADVLTLPDAWRTVLRGR